MTCPRPILAVLLLAAAIAGCDKACGWEVYPTQSDIGADGKPLPQTGWVRTYSEADLIDPLDPARHGIEDIQDLEVGDGRFAQATRLMTVTFTVSNAAGRELGGGRLRFLYPPVSPETGFRLGRAPDFFANGLAGMRVGGERAFTAPSEHDPYRAFTDYRTMRSVFQLPETGRLTYRVKLEAVCRPEICVREVYSVPAMTTRELYVKHCD